MARKKVNGKTVKSANRVVQDEKGEDTRDYSAAKYARYEALGAGERVVGTIVIDLAHVPERFVAPYIAAQFLKLDHGRNGVINGEDSRDLQEVLTEVYETIRDGGWTHRKADGGLQNEALIVEAIHRLRGGKLEKAQAWWGGLTLDEKREHAKRPGVPETVRIIQGERASAKLNEAGLVEYENAPSFE
ncbi:MAG: hypothetical protein ACREJW_02155 [Candidatus Methylomirabilales bacterium]